MLERKRMRLIDISKAPQTTSSRITVHCLILILEDQRAQQVYVRRLPFCLSACLHACTSACMSVCVYACMHVCMYVCLHVCMSVCLHVCMYACMNMYIYIYIYIYFRCGFRIVVQNGGNVKSSILLFNSSSQTT